MAGLLDPRQGDGSYVENRPSKLAQTWGILGPYITDPFTGAINWTRDMMNADPYTLLADTGPRAQALAQGGAEVATNVMGAGSVVPKPDDALNMGFRVFHGSPHDFPPVRLIEMPDGKRLYQNMSELAETPQGARIIQEYPMGRFDLSKIGTGEGAQAYGHGLYFAENERIARSYRDALATGVKPELRPTDKYSTVGWKAEAEKLFPNDKERQAAFHLFNQMKNKDYVLNNHDFITSLPHNQGKPYEWEGVEFTRDRLSQLADEFYDPGHMYEVEIDADPNAFLDWDKPLSEQPEVAKKLGFATRSRDELEAEFDALIQEGNARAARAGGWMDYPELKERYDALYEELDRLAPSQTGADFYRGTTPDNFLHSVLSGGNSDPTASSELLAKGIPGIKYLDAGSRTAGEGSRNYVVFDDNLINIIRKYGIAGLLGGSAAMDAMMSEQQNTQ